MSLLPQKTLIATEAIIFIALKQTDKAVASKDISEYMGVSLRYLEQLMQKLVKAGILKGLRGSQGGYVLGKDRRKITLAEIYSATKEPVKDIRETEIAKNIVLPADNGLLQEVSGSLAGITLQDLYDSARTQNISVNKKRSSDFII